MGSVFDSDMVQEITDDQMWDRLVDQMPGRVMVEFFVTWCPHCQREAPILDAAAIAIRAMGVEVYHANAEVMYDKGPAYGLTETPSFILVEDGKLIAAHEGFLDERGLIAFARDEIGQLDPPPEKGLSTTAW